MVVVLRREPVDREALIGVFDFCHCCLVGELNEIWVCGEFMFS